MSESLQTGQEFRTTDFGTVRVGKFLGSGAQGEVFEVQTDRGPRALKWYYPSMATPEQRQALQQVVDRAPNDRSRLLWPEALIDARPSFGYVMELRPPEFVTLSKVVAGRIDLDLTTLVRAAIGLVRAFREIQTAGLAYRDIKDPNVFINPATGDILVCDNDNCVADSTFSQIKGTTDFCAPEILVAGARPSSTTDRHSLAVLLFMLLVRGHPLDGKRERMIKCLDERARVYLYGEAPLYVFDRNSNENAPVPGVHDAVARHYPIWPQDLQDLWFAAFERGLHNPAERPTLLQWLTVLLRVHDSIQSCANCGSLTIADPNTTDTWDCWSCHSQVELGPRCVIGRRTILLRPGVAIFDHHLEDSPANTDFTTPRFTVTQHPDHASVLGLRNDGDQPQTYTSPDGKMQSVEPGRSALVADGAVITTSTSNIRFLV